MNSNHMPSRLSSAEMIMEHLLEDPSLREEENMHHDSPVLYEQEQAFADEEGHSDDAIEMIIQLDSTRSATLLIHSEDDPAMLAKKFCFKNNIDPRVIALLTNNIQNAKMASFGKAKGDYRETLNDKENKSMLQNTDLSGNSKCSKAEVRRSVKGGIRPKEWIEESRTNEGGTTMQSQKSYISVFDRLYQDSRHKAMRKSIQLPGGNYTPIALSHNRMSSQLQHSQTNQSLNNSVSSCLQIYDKNTKLKYSAQKKNESLLQLKLNQQMQDCRFKPVINAVSDMIVNRLREAKDCSGSDMMDQRLKSHEKHMMKIKEYIQQKEAQEMSECTFEPMILPQSRKQQTLTDRHVLLHEDYHLREAKKRMISQHRQKQQAKVGPKINQISEQIVKGRSFFQRLQEDASRRAEKKESQQRIRWSLDKHHPMTGRDPIVRNKCRKTIGEYLYSKMKSPTAEPAPRCPPKVLIDPNSQQIYQRNKRTAFHYLFILLDDDQDGLISNTKIKIEGLDEQILKIVAPLLSEMEEVQTELNEEEFISAISRLFETLNVSEKNTILNVYKNRSCHESRASEPSFHPMLNQKSIQISREIREPGVDLYEISLQQQTEKEAKLNELRALQKLQEAQQCTFHPRLFR